MIEGCCSFVEGWDRIVDGLRLGGAFQMTSAPAAIVNMVILTLINLDQVHQDSNKSSENRVQYVENTGCISM